MGSDQEEADTALVTLQGLDRERTCDAEWGPRSRFWLKESKPKAGRRTRERERRALILTGHGLSLRVDKGSLLVQDGYTHYPAERREWRFFSGALDIPPAFVVLDGSGNITIDAIDWLARQRVPLIRIRWDGHFASIVTSGGQAASADKVDWQQRTRRNPRARLAFAADIVRQKANNTLATLEGYLPRGPLWDRACKNIEARAKALKSNPPRTFASLLGVEGSIAGTTSAFGLTYPSNGSRSSGIQFQRTGPRIDRELRFATASVFAAMVEVTTEARRTRSMRC